MCATPRQAATASNAFISTIPTSPNAPRRWPGPRPLSEPESRFLHEQMARFKPHLIVSIHAPYGVLDFDGPTVPPSRLGRLYLDQVGIFPGSLGNYGGVHKGVPVVTIELPNAMRTPLEFPNDKRSVPFIHLGIALGEQDRER